MRVHGSSRQDSTWIYAIGGLCGLRCEYETASLSRPLSALANRLNDPENVHPRS